MARKKVTFGSQPKPQANLDDWVETREVRTEPETPPTDKAEPMPPKAKESKEKLKRLTLDIPESLHRKIKGKAVMEGVTMIEMLRELLEENYG
ncbi:hypothetical protein [Sphaerothrix gracilis]|uniref:hypothetical protein n=1 Tax=Sphaerothrix gracilis TaxID=3151835 RepID=UPI0031FD58F7